MMTDKSFCYILGHKESTFSWERIMCYKPLGLINSHCFLFHTYFIPKANSLTNNANFFIIGSMKTSVEIIIETTKMIGIRSLRILYVQPVTVFRCRIPNETQRVGPLLLQDLHLIDLISHFDRERIPERVVHTPERECGEAVQTPKRTPAARRFIRSRKAV